MMLDPLAEIRIRVLMPVRVSRGQFMVDILRDGKRRQPEEDADHPQDKAGLQQRRKRPDSCSQHQRTGKPTVCKSFI